MADLWVECVELCGRRAQSRPRAAYVPSFAVDGPYHVILLWSGPVRAGVCVGPGARAARILVGTVVPFCLCE